MEFGSKDENHNMADFLSMPGKDQHIIEFELLISSMAALNIVIWS